MKKQVKVSKGYRLFPQTHKTISKIKKILNADTDKAVFSACANFISTLKQNPKIK